MTIKGSQLEQPPTVSRNAYMRVLISFASTEGQTRKVAERIALLARTRGHEANIYDTASLISLPEVDGFDAVVVAASVHEEHHQDSAINFAAAHRDQLARRPSAFVSVSLSAALAGGQAEAQHYVDRFIATAGWTPTKILLLGGALHWSECDYFQRQVLKHNLLKGPVYPQENAHYEFTDWVALENFIDGFLASCVRVGDLSLGPTPLLH